jgi:hypothetical protein
MLIQKNDKPVSAAELRKQQDAQRRKQERTQRIQNQAYSIEHKIRSMAGELNFIRAEGVDTRQAESLLKALSGELNRIVAQERQR